MSLSQTLSQIRNRINYLRRKYAIPLAIARLIGESGRSLSQRERVRAPP